MGLYKCIIIDDNEIDRLYICTLVQHNPKFEILGIYDNALEVISNKSYLEADVLFLDIDMPEMSGLEFRKVAESVPACVFISSYSEYAIDSFELDTLDFIQKPVRIERFNQMVERLDTFFNILSKAKQFEYFSADKSIFIREGTQEIKINVDDILYLEALKNYTLVITKEKKLCISSSIGKLLTHASFSAFRRVHRSYAISKAMITSITPKEIKLCNGFLIPVGRKFKDEIKDFY